MNKTNNVANPPTWTLANSGLVLTYVDNAQQTTIDTQNAAAEIIVVTDESQCEK